MLQINLYIAQSVIDDINRTIRQINGWDTNRPALSANEIAKEALAVYNWAIEQVRAGYAVVAMNVELAPVYQIATPNLPALAPTSI